MADRIRAALDDVLEQLSSDASRRVYESDWTRYLAWLGLEGVKVEETRPRHIVAYMAHLRRGGKVKATAGRTLSVIRTVYAALVRDEVMETNPAREVKNPKMGGAPKTPWLTEEQVRQLFALPAESWGDRRDRLGVRLLFGLAWRRAEIARLTVEDFDGATVTGIVKGGKELTVGVPAWLCVDRDAWLRWAKIKAGPILPRSKTDPRAISGDLLYKAVRKEVERAGLPPIGPHALRRTNITLGGKRGVSLRARQLAVGHASQSTTERYDRANEAASNAPGDVFADLVNHPQGGRHGR